MLRTPVMYPAEERPEFPLHAHNRYLVNRADDERRCIPEDLIIRDMYWQDSRVAPLMDDLTAVGIVAAMHNPELIREPVHRQLLLTTERASREDEQVLSVRIIPVYPLDAVLRICDQPVGRVTVADEVAHRERIAP